MLAVLRRDAEFLRQFQLIDYSIFLLRVNEQRGRQSLTGADMTTVMKYNQQLK